MLKVILVTLVFTFAGGEVEMKTTVDTMQECREIIQSITNSVGKENVHKATCEEIK